MVKIAEKNGCLLATCAKPRSFWELSSRCHDALSYAVSVSAKRVGETMGSIHGLHPSMGIVLAYWTDNIMTFP